MAKFRVICRSLVCLCIPSLLPVAESDDIIDCSTDSRDFDDDTFTVTCPAGCSQVWDERARVWGTDIYGDASSICRAAIHDSRITDTGGQVTVYKWSGQDSYQASERNGIQSLRYGSWRSSFSFTPEACPLKLGMEDETIEDEDITAPSNQWSWPPSDARLNGNRAWFPSEPFEGSWIQVDLRQRKTVSGVITQGYSGNSDYWVTGYEVHYLSTSGSRETITDQSGIVMNFSGNTDPDGRKTNMFDSPIVTQVIRLYPTSWESEPGLRMELLGCESIASTTQSTTVIRTTSTASQSTYTAPANTSPQTVGSSSSVTLSTAVFSTAVLDGEHEERKDPRGSLGVGAIAGIAAGVSVVLIALVVLVIIFLRKRQSNNKGASNVPRNPPEQRFRNPEYSDVTATNEQTAPAQDEGFTDCELYNTEDNNPYEPYNYANSGQISGGEISQPSHDYDYATIPGESDRGVVDNVIYETSDMT